MSLFLDITLTVSSKCLFIFSMMLATLVRGCKYITRVTDVVIWFSVVLFHFMFTSFIFIFSEFLLPTISWFNNFGRFYSHLSCIFLNFIFYSSPELQFLLVNDNLRRYTCFHSIIFCDIWIVILTGNRSQLANLFVCFKLFTLITLSKIQMLRRSRNDWFIIWNE